MKIKIIMIKKIITITKNLICKAPRQSTEAPLFRKQVIKTNS